VKHVDKCVHPEQPIGLRVTFGAITPLQSVERDVRHVCSFSCARRALIEMCNNLKANEGGSP
jgi:hypothetical protein